MAEAKGSYINKRSAFKSSAGHNKEEANPTSGRS